MHPIEKSWYQKRPSWLWAPLTVPLAGLYAGISGLKRLAYQRGLVRAKSVPVPVIVVGNIAVGGTGKTPFTLWLVEQLTAAGFRPGVVSRGYGGKRDEDVLLVTTQTSPQQCGDEPAMLAQREVCPVVVGKKRPEAAQYLLEHIGVDVIIADDGLQHYRLHRNFEIVLVDGQRGVGNGWLLPMGPLRESACRLQSVDAVVINGAEDLRAMQPVDKPMVVNMLLQPDSCINLLTGEAQSFQQLFDAESKQGVLAVAGIGNPQRFLRTLESLRGTGNLAAIELQPLPDHHDFLAKDLPLDRVIVMTEKDAVKCRSLVQKMQHAHCWMLPVQATLTDADTQRIMQPLLKVINGFTNGK